MFTKKGLSTLALLTLVGNFSSVSALSFDDLISNQQVYFATSQTKPAKGGTYTDKVFGTTVKRLTDGQADGFNGMVPDYSKRQAWNLDGSLMMIRDADSNVQLHDGKNYSFWKTLDGVGGEDVFWSPISARDVWYNDGTKLLKVNVDSGVTSTVFEFTDYTWANTRGEGNLSRDGKSYAVVGQNYNENSGEVTFKDLVLVDLEGKRILKKLALPADLEGFDWVSISPLGNYIVVDYANDGTTAFHGLEVYDRSFQLKWRKPIGAGHSDLGVDENGKEFLLMDYYNNDENVTEIKKFDLASGNETILLTLSPVFDLHESCRNIQRNGWCLISTFDYVQKLSATSADWLPFENEVFLLKLDGSKTVKRLAHHHSRRYSPSTPDSDSSNYFAEPHATISPDGNKIIFASNWEQNLTTTNSVDTYLIDLGSSVATTNNTQIFTDVSSVDPGYDAIKFLKDNQIVSGYPDGSFRPNQTINRAEFVKIVVGMNFKKNGSNLDTDTSLDGLLFSDIESGQWYLPYLKGAVLLLLIEGYPDGTFRPINEISLVEASKILVIAAGETVESGGVTWYQPYIDVMKKYNAIPTSITKLDQKITRREMAEMIYALNK